MKIITYDNHFNLNEWFVILMLIAGMMVTLFLPRRFPANRAAVYFLYGIFGGLFLDHSISQYPIDYYDVNDTDLFQWMDFLTYFMYGPFSYLFAYFLDRWKIKPAYAPLYAFFWALFSLGMEWIAVKAGVFHYKNGYKIAYSLPIYLVMNSLYLIFLYGINGLLRRRSV